MERQTFQKKIILDHLKSVTTHPSAEEVYLIARKKMPNISRGTVYRILNNFRRGGKVQEIQAEVAHFDGDNSSHAHFICRSCNKIFDVFSLCRECDILKKTKTKVGEIKNYQINFYGYCKKCKKQ